MLRAVMEPMKLTKSERETLKAVYRLTKGDEPAHTGDLAEKLEVSPSTVTTTVKRLADRGLVEHQLYKGVILTAGGRRGGGGGVPRPPRLPRCLLDKLASAWDEGGLLAPTRVHHPPPQAGARPLLTP